MPIVKYYTAQVCLAQGIAVYKKNNGFENQTRAQLKTVLLNLSENSYCCFAYISQLAEFLVVLIYFKIFSQCKIVKYYSYLHLI